MFLSLFLKKLYNLFFLILIMNPPHTTPATTTNPSVVQGADVVPHCKTCHYTIQNIVNELLFSLAMVLVLFTINFFIIYLCLNLIRCVLKFLLVMN